MSHFQLFSGKKKAGPPWTGRQRYYETSAFTVEAGSVHRSHQLHPQLGLHAGAVFSGGRYEYRDSINLPQSDYKVKYKGPELQKLQQQGVHVVVVNKHDKTGTEVKDARAECQNMTAAAQTSASAAAANTAVKHATGPTQVAAPASPTPAVAPAKPCVETMLDAQGHESCGKWQ